MGSFNLFLPVLLSLSLITINIITLPLDALNIDRSLVITPFVFSIILLFLFISLIYVKRIFFMPREMFLVFVCFIFTIIVPSLVGFVRNDPIEVFPSLLRYFSYFLAFVLFFHFYLINSFSLKTLDKIIKILTIIFLACSLIQIAQGNMIFMNGAYRLSSVYGNTPAGFALITLVFSIYFYCQMLVAYCSRYERIILFSYFIFNAIMMVMTQSRQSVVTLLLLISFFHFVRARKLFKIFTLIFAALLAYGFYWLVLNTDLFPRLTQMLFNYASDSSTHTRIEIITQTYAHLDTENIIYGIGLGGFNRFYYDITGELGVAAHNDFFLFFVEGGVLSLFFYCLFILGGFLFWSKVVRKKGQAYITPLCVFTSLYIFSFLNNPYYYPQVQVIAAAMMGGFLAKYLTDLKKDQHVLP
ncbi:O-antigen polymerase [Enterobacter cancerogenus]|uniref:O-antigen ligase family protein n=1 Tax=Enterobacter cancerogenus TaxID=69218 RepID=UPI00192718C8|nr:O-antigen ligase family protein [Enterobacter cancerogenus]CAD5356734.1 O-antigen polymerase [Enterobacter cancerogenus]